MHQHAAPTPYSPALVETLQTVVAPGERAQLSPFVEAAQFQVLFGQRPKPASRHKDARRILQHHEHDIRDLADRWVKFKGTGKQFAPGAYDEGFLKSYLAYYLTTNVCKLQLTLLELVRQGRLSDSLTILDVGVGTGTTAVAALDFLIAWAHICTLYGAEFPIQSVQLVVVDVNLNCLKFAQKVVLAYADALAARWKPDSEDRTASGILKRAEGWARGAQWNTCDLNQQSLQIAVHQADQGLAVQSSDRPHLIQKILFCLLLAGLNVALLHHAQVLPSFVYGHLFIVGHFSLRDIISEGMRSIDKIPFLWYNLFQKETKFRVERVVRLAKGSIRRAACAPCW